MSQLYKDTFRTLMMDQHFPPEPYITFENFNADDQIKKCMDAYVDSLHVTMKCHWGHSYYNTKVGVLHPGLKGRDMAGELVEAGRKKGLEMIGYYCIIWDNIAALNNPSWRMIGRDGKQAYWHTLTSYQPLHSWRCNCFMGGYRKYCLDQIYEFCSQYDIDGVFIDAFALGNNRNVTVCYCPVCMERYARLGLDPYSDDPAMRLRMVEHWAQNYADFTAEIKQTMDRARPGLSLSQNGGPLVAGSALLNQLDWIYNEGGEHPYNSISIRCIPKDGPQCGIPAGNDAYDVWPQSVVRLMTSTVLAHGSRTFFFFLQGRYPDGTFEASKYDFLRLINRETAEKQQYVKGAKPLKAAAVYHSERSQMEYGARDQCGYNDGEPATAYYRRIGNTLDMLRKESIPCELLPGWEATPEALAEFQIILLPELTIITQQEVRLLENYVAQGGVLLVTGETGLVDIDGRARENFALSTLLGVDYQNLCDDYKRQGSCGFLRPGDHPYFRFLRKADYYYGSGSFIKVKPATADVLAMTVEPLDVESETNYIGWGFLPPGKKTEWAVLTDNKFGKGHALYCAAPLARLSSQGIRWPHALLKGIITAENVSCGIDLIGPKNAVQATFFTKDGRVYVHLLNESVKNNNGDIVPVACSLSITGRPFTVARVVYPQPEKLNIRDGRIEIPRVELHTIVELLP